MKHIGSIVLLVSVLFLNSMQCGGIKPTVFVHQEYNFAFIERVAVIPFENLSKDQGAGARVTRLFVGELLSAEAFDIVEPGEVSRALMKYSLVRTADLTREQVVEIGKELGVQALFLGSVNESETTRAGGANVSMVTLTVRLLETEEGTTIWSATNTSGGRGFWSSLFGTGEKSKTEVTRNCIKKTLNTLID